MRVRLFFSLAWAIVGLGFCPSCKEERPAPVKAGEKSGKADVRGWKPHARTDRDVQLRDANPILHGISRKQFDRLDQFIPRFDEHYPDGMTIREAFYDKFGNYDDYNQVDPEKWNPVYHANLTEWRDLDPNAPTPWIALAEFEQHLAWAARGHGYADTVTEEGWKEFAAHYEASGKLLADAPESAREDPHYFRSAISIGLAQAWPFEQVQKVFEAGQEVDPLYLPLYHGVTNYLQPKWYGDEPDDWAEWLDLVLEHPELSEDDRLVIYGTVVRTTIRSRYDDFPNVTALDKTLGVDRARFMRGLSAYNRRFPDSMEWPSYYLYHAWKAEDESAIQEALEMMDGRFSPAAFGGEDGFHKTLQDVEGRFPALATLVAGKR